MSLKTVADTKEAPSKPQDHATALSTPRQTRNSKQKPPLLTQLTLADIDSEFQHICISDVDEMAMGIGRLSLPIPALNIFGCPLDSNQIAQTDRCVTTKLAPKFMTPIAQPKKLQTKTDVAVLCKSTSRRQQDASKFSPVKTLRKKSPVFQRLYQQQPQRQRKTAEQESEQAKLYSLKPKLQKQSSHLKSFGKHSQRQLYQMSKEVSEKRMQLHSARDLPKIAQNTFSPKLIKKLLRHHSPCSPKRTSFSPIRSQKQTDHSSILSQKSWRQSLSISISQATTPTRPQKPCLTLSASSPQFVRGFQQHSKIPPPPAPLKVIGESPRKQSKILYEEFVSREFKALVDDTTIDQQCKGFGFDLFERLMLKHGYTSQTSTYVIQHIFKAIAKEASTSGRKVLLMQMKDLRSIVYCVRNHYSDSQVLETEVRPCAKLQIARTLQLSDKADFEWFHRKVLMPFNHSKSLQLMKATTQPLVIKKTPQTPQNQIQTQTHKKQQLIVKYSSPRHQKIATPAVAEPVAVIQMKELGLKNKYMIRLDELIAQVDQNNISQVSLWPDEQYTQKPASRPSSQPTSPGRRSQRQRLKISNADQLLINQKIQTNYPVKDSPTKTSPEVTIQFLPQNKQLSKHSQSEETYDDDPDDIVFVDFKSCQALSTTNKRARPSMLQASPFELGTTPQSFSRAVVPPVPREDSIESIKSKLAAVISMKRKFLE